MNSIELLQLTVNSFKAQAENLDQEISQGTMMLESMKQARSSILASMSVLETRIEELEAEQPEQFEFDLEPLTYDDEADRFAAPDNVIEHKFGSVRPLIYDPETYPEDNDWPALGKSCATDGEECESCQ